MHLPDEIIHPFQGLSGRGNKDINTRVNDTQISVGYNYCNLNQGIAGHIESRHFAIDPHQWFFQITHVLKCRLLTEISLFGVRKCAH